LSGDSFGEGPDDGTQQFCEPPQEQAEVESIKACTAAGNAYKLNGNSWAAVPIAQIKI
jgi:hypothetical protein